MINNSMKKRKDQSNNQGIDASVPPLQGNDIENEKETSFEKIKRLLIGTAFFLVAGYGLYEIDFFNVLLYSNAVNRFYLNVAIVFSTFVMYLSCYLEFYRKLFKRQHVTYETAKTTTHVMLFSIVISAVCFHIGLWPIWQWKTPFIMFMWSWGFLFQILVIFPLYGQYLLYGAMYLWFMNYYIAPYLVIGTKEK